MTENIETKPIVLPVCPYCKTTMEPCHFNGYYEDFPFWGCECDTLPKAERVSGQYL
jgi:hypothetical protein